MGENFYKQLTKRNGYFIPANLQKKISETTLVFIGCGLASSVAVGAARLGFIHFVLVDGDTVEVSNLNRQDFTTADIGKNKALSLSKRIKLINPDAQVKVVEKHLNIAEVEDIVSRGHIIINSADFDEVTYEIDRVAAGQNKLSISPLNIGFGTIITAFNDKSKRLIEMTNGVAKNDKEYLLNFYKGLNNYKLPKYVEKNIAKIFLFIATKGFFPQNYIAAGTSTTAILNTIVRSLAGKPIKLAPEAISFDFEDVYESK